MCEEFSFPDSEKWIVTIDDKMEFVRKNHVWDLNNLLPSVTLLGINKYS